MLQYLINLIGRLGQWGYLVIFIGATLESAAFLGLVVPGESLVLVAGFFAAQGSLDLDVLIITVAVGAALGDSIGYEMGRRMERPALVRHFMTYAFHRGRPSFDNPLLVLTTYSFPSGHVAGATLFYGVMAAMLVMRIKAWRWRVMIVLAAIAMVALVALTRMYLGVHYLSDVLAAFVEEVAWLTLCLTGIHTYWEHRIWRQSQSIVKR